MKIPKVIGFKQFHYGYVKTTQDHELESDLLPWGDPHKLIPMGPKYWHGQFTTLMTLSIGEKINIGDYLPEISGEAFITEIKNNKYTFEGMGELK